MKKLIGMVMGLAAGVAWAYDASSYVQDGLIAQWDGVDNTALGWMTSDATDLYGRPRVVNRLPDIGCCENPQSGLMLEIR